MDSGVRYMVGDPYSVMISIIFTGSVMMITI